MFQFLKFHCSKFDENFVMTSNAVIVTIMTLHCCDCLDSQRPSGLSHPITVGDFGHRRQNSKGKSDAQLKLIPKCSVKSTIVTNSSNFFLSLLFDSFPVRPEIQALQCLNQLKEKLGIDEANAKADGKRQIHGHSDRSYRTIQKQQKAMDEEVARWR